MKSQAQIDSIVNGILSYLQEKKALDLLPEVAQSLIKQSFLKIDPNLAIVSSSVKLDSSQRQQIKASLSKLYQRPIRLKTKLDRSIIAGLKIEIAGQVIDATLNRKLVDLKHQVIYD